MEPRRPTTYKLTPIGLMLATSCAQGTFNQSAASVLSSVILAGNHGGTGGGSATTASSTRVISTAQDYIGTPYKWGGSTPQTGFDCSGYVKYVFAKQGVALPRTSREQAGAGKAVSPSVGALHQGDIMLFAEPHETISHVAIYAGGNRIIHSSSSGHGVRYDELGTQRGQWFVEHMVAARRLTDNGRSLVQSLELLARPGLPFDPPDKAPAPR